MAGERNISVTLGAVDQSGAAFASYQKNLQQLEKAIGNLSGSTLSLSSIDWAKSLVKDVAPARDTIAGLRSEVARVTKELESIPIGSSKFTAYTSLATHLKSELSDAVGPTRSLSGGVQEVNKHLGTSGILAMNLGRVISDMPYGMIGIANNLEPLATSFARVKEEAALTGKSVTSQLLGAIGGPMGLAMVGIPIVTSLALVFGKDLVNAIRGSGESIDDLRDKLSGLSQYKDFSLEVKIAGLDGIEKLKAQLEMLMLQKNYLETGQGLDQALESAKAWRENIRWHDLSSKSSEHYKQADSAVREAQDKIDQYDSWFAARISAGLGSTGDQKKDAALLVKWRPSEYNEKTAAYQVEINKKAAEVDVARAQIGLAQTNKNNKNSRSGDSAADKAAREAEALRDAIYAANKALSDMGKNALPSIEDAAKKVEETTGLLKSAIANGNKDEIQNQTKALTDQKSILNQTTSAWESAIKRADTLLVKGEQSALSYADAQDEVRKAEQAVIDARALGSANTHNLILAEDNLALAQTRLQKATQASTKQINEMQGAFRQIGDVVTSLGGNGQGVTALLSGIGYLTGDNMKSLADSRFGGDTSQAQAYTYSSIGQAIGQISGSKTISNTASLAGAGFAIGSIIPGIGSVAGSIIGGGLGLISSLFGGGASAQDVSNAESASTSAWKSISDLAAAGNPTAREMMRRVGYSQHNGAVNSKESWFTGLGFDSLLGGTRDFGMFYTKENGYNSDVLAYLNNLEKIDGVIRGFASTSMAQQIDQINYKYKEMLATSGDLANAEKARLLALASATIGVTADTIGTFISDAVAANPTGKAGAAFSAKFEESIATAIRNMAISNLVTQSIMPVLQPVITSITSGLISGTLTTGAMKSLMSSVTGVTKSVSPMINTLASAFSSAGLLTSSSSTSTLSTTGATKLYGSQLAMLRDKYGIPAFANGGSHLGGLRIVGENGPELEYTGSSRIMPLKESVGTTTYDDLIREMQLLRAEVRAGQTAIAKNTAKTASNTDQWNEDGMPKTRDY